MSYIFIQYVQIYKLTMQFDTLWACTSSVSFWTIMPKSWYQNVSNIIQTFESFRIPGGTEHLKSVETKGERFSRSTSSQHGSTLKQKLTQPMLQFLCLICMGIAFQLNWLWDTNFSCGSQAKLFFWTTDGTTFDSQTLPLSLRLTWHPLWLLFSILISCLNLFESIIPACLYIQYTLGC